MQHVPSWLQAAVLPMRWRVAGVSCPALTVWHHYALSELRNGYLAGVPTNKDDAAALLAICSRDYRRGVWLFQSPPHLRVATERASRAVRRRKWAAVDEACTAYIRDCGRVPQHTEAPVHIGPGGKHLPSTSRTCAAPLHWALVSHLSLGNPGAVEAAWNTTYATARCLFDAYRDIEGKSETLESVDEERRIDAWLEEQKAEGQDK